MLSDSLDVVNRLLTLGRSFWREPSKVALLVQTSPIAGGIVKISPTLLPLEPQSLREDKDPVQSVLIKSS